VQKSARPLGKGVNETPCKGAVLQKFKNTMLIEDGLMRAVFYDATMKSTMYTRKFCAEIFLS
jgi:hypothetical protein